MHEVNAKTIEITNELGQEDSLAFLQNRVFQAGIRHIYKRGIKLGIKSCIHMMWK